MTLAHVPSQLGVEKNFVLIVVLVFESIKRSLVSRHWLKERRIFTQNVFLVHVQTKLEVNESFVQFNSLSAYRNDQVPLAVFQFLSSDAHSNQLLR